MDWKGFLRELVTAGPPVYRSLLLAPSESKIAMIAGYESAPLLQQSGTLIHGPGATALINAPHNADGNSALFACLMTLMDAYCEPPLRVYRRTGPGKQRELPDHPLQALLDDPNPTLTAEELWSWVCFAKALDGNAFLRKIRTGHPTRGLPIELWPLPPTRVELLSEGAFISGYRYWWAPGKHDDIPPENIVHYRRGLDPQDQRRGLSSVKRLIRQVTSDERATAWTDRLLANYALPGLLVKVKRELTADQAAELKAHVRSLFSGDRMGDVGVLDNDSDFEQFGFNPDEMQLAELHKIPETRIAAATRVPAIVAGLQAGLERSTFANFKEAREAFTEGTMVPLWRADAARTDKALRPDFERDPKVFVGHDLTLVRALQEDVNARGTRLHTAVGGPYMTPNEARAEQGLPPLKGELGDMLFVPTTVTPTAPDDPSLTADAPPAVPTPLPAPGPTTGGAPPSPPPPSDRPGRAAAGRSAAPSSKRGQIPPDDEDVADALRFWERALGADDPLADLLAASARNGNGRH